MLNKFRKIPDYSGHNIYVGLDVHKSSWSVNIMVDEIEHRQFTQPPSPLILYKYLSESFPGANYFSAYECGFSGYHHHRELLDLGIQNIVFNPADLPVTNKEKSPNVIRLTAGGSPVHCREISLRVCMSLIPIMNSSGLCFGCAGRLPWKIAGLKIASVRSCSIMASSLLPRSNPIAGRLLSWTGLNNSRHRTH